ncbi:MAG: TIGR02453 family protein [Pseudomonadota bacterium]
MTQQQFEGFGPDALKFLTALGFHQSREWFHENKKMYEREVKEPLGLFIESASDAMEAAGLPFHGSRKSSLFRINRDVRFAKEKHPYNTHVSGVLTRNGTKKDPGGVYFHYTPDNCLFASGLWMPDGKQIKAVREAIVEDPKTFLKLEADLESHGLAFGTDRNLKRPAPGFKDVENEEVKRLLHQRSFVVERKVHDTAIFSAKLVDELVDFAKVALPLNEYFERVLGPLREEDGNA